MSQATSRHGRYEELDFTGNQKVQSIHEIKFKRQAADEPAVHTGFLVEGKEVGCEKPYSLKTTTPFHVSSLGHAFLFNTVQLSTMY